MYTTAKKIMQQLKEKRLLKREFEKPEFKDYQLVLSGHSLGAGVVSVLSIMLQKEYPDLKCYAFSPPGCIFRSVVRVVVEKVSQHAWSILYLCSGLPLMVRSVVMVVWKSLLHAC